MTESQHVSPSISVQLNEKNQSYWSYVIKNLLKGMKMQCYVSGTSVRPKDDKVTNYMKFLKIWEFENSKIITWINNFIVQSIGTQLGKYDIAKVV